MHCRKSYQFFRTQFCKGIIIITTPHINTSLTHTNIIHQHQHITHHCPMPCRHRCRSHINTSTYQHINTSTHQHNTSTHQHINTSTHQHINTSTSHITHHCHVDIAAGPSSTLNHTSTPHTNITHQHHTSTHHTSLPMPCRHRCRSLFHVESSNKGTHQKVVAAAAKKTFVTLVLFPSQKQNNPITAMMQCAHTLHISLTYTTHTYTTHTYTTHTYTTHTYITHTTHAHRTHTELTHTSPTHHSHITHTSHTHHTHTTTYS